MEIASGRLKVEKTARYFVNGDPQLPYDEVVFVLHGYGMKADDFLKSFAILERPGRLIVAPEGLSRFYKKAFSGDVVASWMTKEDRLSEIEDYITYLDKLFSVFVKDSSVKPTVIGFSQGTATASRWIMNGKSQVENFVIWCGEFARDYGTIPSKLPKIWHVYALKDEFIALDRFEDQSEFLKSIGFQVVDFSFDGGHTIDEPTLQEVSKAMSV